MSSGGNNRISLALLTAAAATTLTVGALIGSPPASAHVHVDADEPVRGETALVTFRVPNESDTASPTTEVQVTLPDLTSVSTAAMPGWTAKLDRDNAAGTVRSVTWSAAPNNGIGPDQFGLFVLRVKLPDSPTVSFPATQTYADGTVVAWDQPPVADGTEPEHPAPALTLAAAGAPEADDHHAPATAATPAETPRAAEPAVEHPGAGPDNVARAPASVWPGGAGDRDSASRRDAADGRADDLCRHRGCRGACHPDGHRSG